MNDTEASRQSNRRVEVAIVALRRGLLDATIPPHNRECTLWASSSGITLGSSRPVRRLVAYYALLALVGFVLFHFVPVLNGLLSGDRLDQLAKTPLLQDGLQVGQVPAPTAGLTSHIEFGLSTAFVFLSTLALMLPVTWVYMSARSGEGHNQSVVQALIVLPMIVAGIVLIVRNSLALAFSLAGVVAAVRFRTNLSDARDVVFIFLAIAVGFAAGGPGDHGSAAALDHSQLRAGSDLPV